MCVIVQFILKPTHHEGNSPSLSAVLFTSHTIISAFFLLVLRTLMGHKANICSLDFHPYGEFVASGSQDTNIKVRAHSEPCVSHWAGRGIGRVSCLRGWAFSSVWGVFPLWQHFS